MKKAFVFVLMLAACSPPGTKEVQDSTTVSDTVVKEMLQPENPVEEQEEVVSDTSRLAIRFEEINQAKSELSEKWFQVAVSTSQYESSSDVTWYFDESISARYFKMTWSAEGREGSVEFFIENNSVICAQEEEDNELVTWCNTTGGIRTTWGEDDATGEKQSLSPEFQTECNESFNRYLEILKTLLKENEVSEKDGDSYTIKVEKTVSYGEDFTESTEVTLPKKVYDALTGG